MLHPQPDSGPGSAPLTLALRRGSLACSEPNCTSVGAVPCAYTDRRQRQCDSAWCMSHQQLAFNAVYCRRHAGIINALGPEHANLPKPDLDNRAPSLANWVGRDLDASIRALMDTHFPGHRLNVSAVVTGGSPRDRSWGRFWKLISDTGIDLAVSVSVAEADDSVVKVMFEGRVLVALTPPWIEARRHAVHLDQAADKEARQRFYALILEDLEASLLEAKARPEDYFSAYR